MQARGIHQSLGGGKAYRQRYSRKFAVLMARIDIQRMKSMEMIIGILLLAGILLAVVYPNETIGFAYSLMNSLRWIRHDVPQNM